MPWIAVRFHELQWAAAAREAERQGFDAMVLASIPSTMIRELRTLVDIPIVGYGETAFNLAGRYGRRVGMLFFNTARPGTGRAGAAVLRAR